jgi:hypothetical protein
LDALSQSGFMTEEKLSHRGVGLHSREYGQLVAQFHTKLSNLLLRRIWGVIIPLGAWGVMTFFIIDGIGRMLARSHPWYIILDILLIDAGIWGYILLSGLIIFGLFFRKTYDAEIYERGFVLMQKGKKEGRRFHYNEIKDMGVAIYTYRQYTIPIYQRCVFVIHVKSEKRAIRITGANIARFRSFCDVATDAFDSYFSSSRNKNV